MNLQLLKDNPSGRQKSPCMGDAVSDTKKGCES